MKEIDREKLNELIKSNESVLIDIREKIEFDEFNIGGLNLPAHTITKQYDFLRNYENIIVVCSNGTRSSIIARLLSVKLNEKNIYHLTEGIF